jgi:hypothetical protein
MGRLFLLLLLLAVAAVINPTLRAQLRPHVQFALDPVYEWSVHSRLAEIRRAVDAERAAGRATPTAREFRGFLRQHYPDSGELDPWGNPFYLRQTRRETVIGSGGRDGRAFTPDDLTLPLTQRP